MAKKPENPEDEDLHMVENADGSVSVGEKPEHEADPDEELDPDDDDDEPLAQAAEGESAEDEEKRAKRRAERARRRRRKDAKIETLSRQLAESERRHQELSQRVFAQERHASSNDLAQIDGGITQVSGELKKLEQAMERAIANQDGRLASAAMREHSTLSQRKVALENAKQAYMQNLQQQENQRSNRQEAPDPRVISNARAWFEKNKEWYRPDLSDRHSRQVKLLEDELSREMSPTDPEYFDELDRRIEEELPSVARLQKKHGSVTLSESGKRNVHPRVAGSGSGSGASGSQKNVPAEYVQALKAAGMWDNPQQRSKMIRKFFDGEKNRQR